MEYAILENLKNLSSVIIDLHKHCVNKVKGNDLVALDKRLRLGCALQKKGKYPKGNLIGDSILSRSGEDIVRALWTEEDYSERHVLIDENDVPLLESLRNIEKMFKNMKMYETEEYKEFRLSLRNLRNSKTSAKKTPYIDYIRQNYQSVYSYLFNEMVYRVKLEYLEGKKNNPDNNAYGYDVNLPDNIADILPPKIKSRNGYKAQKASDFNSEETSEDIPSHNATKKYSLIPPSSSSWRTDAFFCGRENDLKQIESFFADETNTFPGSNSKLLYLCGERGIGKTSIIKRYCINSANSHKYKYIFFMSLSGNDTKESVIPVEFCRKVKFSDNISKDNDKSWEDYYGETLEKLKSLDLGRTLFIFDNLDYNAINKKSLNYLYEIINGIKADYLISTYLDVDRNKQIPKLDDRHIYRICPLGESELADIYANKAQCDCNDESIYKTIELLHSNTLAIEAVASEAYEMGYTPAKMLSLLSEFGISENIGSTEIDVSYEDEHTTPWLLFRKLYDWDSLKTDLMPYAKQVLFAMALSPESGISENLLVSLLNLDETRAISTINNLVRRSWIYCTRNGNDKVLFIHPLKGDIIMSIVREEGIPDNYHNSFLYSFLDLNYCFGDYERRCQIIDDILGGNSEEYISEGIKNIEVKHAEIFNFSHNYSNKDLEILHELINSSATRKTKHGYRIEVLKLFENEKSFLISSILSRMVECKLLSPIVYIVISNYILNSFVSLLSCTGQKINEYMEELDILFDNSPEISFDIQIPFLAYRTLHKMSFFLEYANSEDRHKNIDELIVRYNNIAKSLLELRRVFSENKRKVCNCCEHSKIAIVKSLNNLLVNSIFVKAYQDAYLKKLDKQTQLSHPEIMYIPFEDWEHELLLFATNKEV